MSRHEGETRRFTTILFTDIVGSTDIARELGDLRWRELVRRHHAIVRRELKRFGGHEVDTAGDGFFAIFDGAGVAIRSAVAICEGVREVGLEVRAGLHAGEVLASEGKAGGIAVNTAARVMAVAGHGEVLVSQTLRDVVAGSSLGFQDHGVHTLKGIEGQWHLYLVASVDGERVAEPLDGAEASKRRLAVEPAAEPERRRPAWILAGVAAVIAAAAVVFALLAGGGEEPDEPDGPLIAAPQGPPPNSVVKLDPTSGETVFVRADVAGAAGNVTADDLEVGLGSGWLMRPPLVYKIDPQDGSSSTIRGLEGDFVGGITVGSEDLWVVGEFLSPVDPATTRVGEAIDYLPGLETFFGASDLVEAFGRVWIASNDGTVIEVDPARGTSDSFEIGDTPERIVATEDAIWVLDASADSVWRFDPETHAPLEPVPMSGSQDEVTRGGGYVWILDASLGTLTPVAEVDAVPREGIAVGADATDVAFGDGSVWVAGDGNVLEIDPTTLRVVRTIEVGDTPISGIAFDEEDGTLWLDIGSEA